MSQRKVLLASTFLPRAHAIEAAGKIGLSLPEKDSTVSIDAGGGLRIEIVYADAMSKKRGEYIYSVSVYAVD